MHDKFQLSNNIGPQPLTKEEAIFRCKAMYEELMEYISAVFETDFDEEIRIFNQRINQVKYKEDQDLESQFDALIDLGVFTMGTAERQGFPWDEGFMRVMTTNLQKELAGSNEASKRGFKRDLVKPDGWKSPILTDLVGQPKGIIVLDGPDGCGKTTLAEKFQEMYGAKIIHLTWSKELEEVMDSYMIDAIQEAVDLSKDNLVILDRAWLSEICYSEAFRDGTNWEGLHHNCDSLLISNRAFNIVCKPLNVNRGIERFNSLKSERKEMYENIDNIFKYYGSIYHGIANTKFKSEYANHIIEAGGLMLREDYIDYDFEIDGCNLTDYCKTTIGRLTELKGKSNE